MNQDTAVARPAPAPYLALALQTACHAVNQCPNVASARATMMKNIDRVRRQIVASRAFIGMDLKLVVAPEYFLTGYPLGDALPAWAEKAGNPSTVTRTLTRSDAHQAGVRPDARRGRRCR